MLASVIINEVAGILNDAGDPDGANAHVRWPIPELLNYMTEAIAAIAEGKPSVFVTITNLNLAPGSTQLLPDTYNRLLDIHFNINPDGTQGPNVLPGVYTLQQAFQKPSCPTDGVVETYSAYPGMERYFFVNPPVPTSLGYTPQVEAVVMVVPQPVLSENQPLYMPGSAPELFQGAIVDWTLYRAYGKDQESQTSMERSKAHFQAFGAYIGMANQTPQKTVKSSGPTQQRVAA